MALINNSQILGSGSTDLILNTRGKIYVKVGDRFYELDFKNEGNKESSITNNTIINNPEQDLSPYVTKKYLKAALGEYVTKRNWEDLMQTKDAIENAQLEGFTESITPITVNTMQMVVGTQNLQFDFITSLKDDTIISPGLYINEFGQLVCPRGVIKHYTLFGPQSVKKDTKIQYYARWTIQGDDGGDYALLDLTEEDKPYYVYLRVNTTGYKDITDDDVTQNIEVDPKSKNTGDWFVSTQSHTIDEEDGYAYLLVALVTGSNAGGRSIGYLNGFTEILPGQITAYVFKTADGNQYLDFLNNKFRIGNNDQYIDWNGENLNIKGSLSVIGGDLKDTLDDLSYITDAIKKGKTTIDGGLVMTGLIELGFGLTEPDNENYYDSFRVMSGINGILKPNDNGVYNYTDPAVWFGGGMLDIENPADLSNPEIYTLVIQKNNGEYNKYLKDTSIEKYLYKWKKGQDTYYSLSESGQPFVNYLDSDEPLKPTLSLTSGTISQFDKFLELTLNTVTFDDPSGTTFQLQGKIQAYKVGETEGNYTVNNIDNGIVEQLSGNFHKYIVSSHEKKSSNNAIKLLGETIFVYLSDNSSIKGIVFTIRNIYYYTRCSSIPKDITGFLHSFTIGDIPFINVYERQDTETFSLYGWKYNDNYIYTLTDYDNPEPKYLYTLSESGIPQYTSDYTIIDCYNNLAKAMFRMNGSGYLANGNISWDTEGNIIMNKISVQSGKIGPLEIESSESGSSVKVKSDNETILDITDKSVVINGKLTTKSGWRERSAIAVYDPFNVEIFSASAHPLSDENITTYVSRSNDETFINAKGAILGGTVTISKDLWYTILEPQYLSAGFKYKITKFELGYNIARISSPIKGHIYIVPVDEVDGKQVINNPVKELFSWTWTGKEQNGVFKLNNLTYTEYNSGAPSFGLAGRKWGVFLCLEKGGQVKSGVASNSWIRIWATTNNEAEITLNNSKPIPGTFIGSNGISSIFGENTKFQWIVPSVMNYNDMSADPRNTGGVFYVEVPFDDNQSQTVGLRIIGCKGPKGEDQTPGIQLSVDGTWHNVYCADDGSLRWKK